MHLLWVPKEYKIIKEQGLINNKSKYKNEFKTRCQRPCQYNFHLAPFWTLSYFRVWLRQSFRKMSTFKIGKEWKKGFLPPVLIHLCLTLWNSDPNYLLPSGRLIPSLLVLSKDPAYLFLKNHREKLVYFWYCWILKEQELIPSSTPFPLTQSWRIQPRKDWSGKQWSYNSIQYLT